MTNNTGKIVRTILEETNLSDIKEKLDFKINLPGKTIPVKKT